MTRNIRRQEMIDYLPPYYAESVIVGNILDREATEITDLNAATTDVLAQFFIDTATWGLANWERVFGITTDTTKPCDQRRSALKAKIRGVGTVTVALIKNVAESFNNGEVSVTEDNANYKITVTFVGTRGVPDNLTDVQNAIRDIIPAHLGLTFAFTYMRWSELDAHNWTWATLTGMNLTWKQFETYR